MRRIDKRADRVEISPEQLTAIVIDTEVNMLVMLSLCEGKACVGSYLRHGGLRDLAPM